MPAAADRPDVGRDLEALAERFAGAALAGSVEGGELAVRLTRDLLVPVLRFFKDERGFNAFEDLIVFDNLRSVDPGRPRFAVTYRLYRFPGASRVRLLVEASEGEALPSAVPVYRAADWAEREAFDMFGLRFEGRPDLRRIYMPDEFEDFPLRKDFPLAGRSRDGR